MYLDHGVYEVSPPFRYKKSYDWKLWIPPIPGAGRRRCDWSFRSEGNHLWKMKKNMLYESSDVFNKKMPHLSFLETSKSSIDRPFFIAMLVDCCNNPPKPASISVANLLKNIQGTTIFTTMISSPLGLVNASCSSPLLCCHSAWPTKTSQFLFCCGVTPTTKQAGLLFRGDPAKNYQQDLYDVGFPQNGSHLMIPACSEILKFGSLQRRSWSLQTFFWNFSTWHSNVTRHYTCSTKTQQHDSANFHHIMHPENNNNGRCELHSSLTCNETWINDQH